MPPAASRKSARSAKTVVTAQNQQPEEVSSALTALAGMASRGTAASPDPTHLKTRGQRGRPGGHPAVFAWLALGPWYARREQLKTAALLSSQAGAEHPPAVAAREGMRPAGGCETASERQTHVEAATARRTPRGESWMAARYPRLAAGSPTWPSTRPLWAPRRRSDLICSPFRLASSTASIASTPAADQQALRGLADCPSERPS